MTGPMGQMRFSARYGRVLLCATALSLRILPAGGQNPEPLRQQAGAGVVALLHDAIIRCWNVPVRPGMAGKVARLRLELSRDGSLLGEPLVLDPQDDPDFTLLAESARRAVIRCAPYRGLTRHAGSYEDWRVVVINFRQPG